MMRTSATSLLRASARAASRQATYVPRAAASTHAISNPQLANIEKRWEGMPPTEQAELWMALRDRMKTNWSELTINEKKAAYWIAFGAHGPRAAAPADENQKVIMYTIMGLLASFGIFAAMRAFAGPAPSTMNKEYQEASNEYLKGQRNEPLTGLSSADYKGTGMVQSAPKH